MKKSVDNKRPNLLLQMPVTALSLRLAQGPICIQHENHWHIDGLNTHHDLIICVEGSAVYELESQPITLESGDAMLIPAFTRFQGHHGEGSNTYVGFAQKFSLELFSRGDVIHQLDLKQCVSLPNWESLEPLIRLYRDTPSTTTTTLSQHHQFMVILLAYLQVAFISWKKEITKSTSRDHLYRQSAETATWLASDPLVDIDHVMSGIPYNEDYFRRVFRDRVGLTPQKFHEQKRMAFAIHLLGMGLSVTDTAAELAYRDPHYFSRQFKRHIGSYPLSYRLGKS